MTIEVSLRRGSNSSNSDDDGYFTSAVSVQHKVSFCSSKLLQLLVPILSAEFTSSCQSTRLRPHLLLLQSVLEVKHIVQHDLQLSHPNFLKNEAKQVFLSIKSPPKLSFLQCGKNKMSYESLLCIVVTHQSPDFPPRNVANEVSLSMDESLKGVMALLLPSYGL